MSRTGHLAAASSLFVALFGGGAWAETGRLALPDGESLYYEDLGHGSPALIVPAHLYLIPWLAPLADGRRVIFYDMRNRGRSSYVEDVSTLTIQQDVADLETLRTHFDLAQVDLVGWSYLGLMVALYAMDHPDNVRRIVQIGPVPINFGTQYAPELTAQDPEPLWTKEEENRIRAQRDAGMIAGDPAAYCLGFMNLTGRGLVGDPADRPALAPLIADLCTMENEWPVNLNRHFEYAFTSVQELTVEQSDIAKVTMPVLVIHGTKDRNADYGSGVEWAYRLPNARLVTVRGAAHMPFIEHPDLVLGAIRTFLGGDWPDQAAPVTDPPPLAQ